MSHIHRYMDHPEAVQHEVLDKLLYKSKHTEWGKTFDFASIKEADSYRQRIPISTYDDLSPFIKRMMKGESDVLWRGRVKWFSKSSGTTNDKSKFIPVPNENLQNCHLKGPHDAMALWYHSKPSTQLFSHGKGLVMGGSLKPYEPFQDTNVGDVSALMLSQMPFYAKYFHSPDVNTALMSEWEEKIDKMAEIVSKEKITNISGVPTWTIVLFRKILEKTGASNILEVFPSFELYMHGGVSFLPYREQFETFLPSDNVQYRGIYNASEGFFATQANNEDEGMLLMLDSCVYYEFIPMSELNTDHPKALNIGEVELNVNYALVISTNAGLWRYLIGDTIMFTSLYPHKIKITGRTKHFINVFGEEIMVDNTDRAIALTCSQLNAQVLEYTVAPIFFSQNQKGGHEWLIEFSKSPEDMTVFAQKLDSNLQALNSDYEAKRYKNIALQQLIINLAKPNTFHTWLQKKGKFGGQNKIPRLSNDRKYLEELLALN